MKRVAPLDSDLRLLAPIMKRYAKISFVKADAPVRHLTTKFGGQPVWLEKPEWPVSRSSGELLTFIGQVVLDETPIGATKGRVAYLFIWGDEDAEEAWDPDGGENAVIVQPGVQFISTQAVATGPSVSDARYEGVDSNEYTIKQEIFEYEGVLDEPHVMDRLGGEPYWLQSDEFPFSNARLFLQLSDCQLPFFVNFGTGCAYFFLNETGDRGKFLWQC